MFSLKFYPSIACILQYPYFMAFIRLHYPMYRDKLISWWRHQMETFSASLAICAGNSPVPRKFPTQRPVSRSFDVFFELRLNKRLSKQSRGWWFKTLSCPLWRYCNDCSITGIPNFENVTVFYNFLSFYAFHHQMCDLWSIIEICNQD